MSMEEFRRLLNGDTLTNTTDHGSLGFKTSSIGFCFTTDAPDEAIHYLSGNIDTDICATFEVNAVQLQQSRATYRDASVAIDDATPLGEDPTIEKVEYCTQEYSLRTFHLLKITTAYQYIPNRAYIEHMRNMMLYRNGQ